MRLRGLLAMSAAVAICGCGGNDEAEQPAAAAPRETVFDPLTDSIERAKGVEDTLKQAEAERRRQLEEAER